MPIGLERYFPFAGRIENIVLNMGPGTVDFSNEIDTGDMWLERRALARSALPDRGKAVTLQTSSVTGALALQLAGALRPLRPHSLRFAREQAAIADWLALLERSLGDASSDAALEQARLPRLLKGYGETHCAGREEFQRRVQDYRVSPAGLTAWLEHR